MKLDPRKIQSMMSKLGINQEEISADRVVIEKSNEERIVIENPQIVKINMQGQESFQITGNIREESDSKINQEDIRTVMEKTGKSESEAKEALEKTNGDLAEAILSLS